MKKQLVLLSLLALCSPISPNNIFVQQPQPGETELQNFFGSDFYFLEGVKRSFFVPQPVQNSLEQAFKGKSGKRVLEQIRSYNKPVLDEKDLKIVNDIIKRSKLKTIGVPTHAVVADSTNHHILIPLRGISERESRSGIFDPISFQQQMVSSIPAWLKIKRVIEQEGLEKLIKIPQNMYAWHYSNLARPNKKGVQFSDRDFLVIYTPVDQLDLQTKADKEQRDKLLANLSLDQINALEILIDKGGLWRMTPVNFDKNGTIVITEFREPDNTLSAPNMGLPSAFYNNSIAKQCWNRYVGFTKLAKVLPDGPTKKRIQERVKKALSLYGEAKEIEQKELTEAYKEMKDELRNVKEKIKKK